MKATRQSNFGMFSNCFNSNAIKTNNTVLPDTVKKQKTSQKLAPVQETKKAKITQLPSTVESLISGKSVSTMPSSSSLDSQGSRKLKIVTKAKKTELFDAFLSELAPQEEEEQEFEQNLGKLGSPLVINYEVFDNQDPAKMENICEERVSRKRLTTTKNGLVKGRLVGTKTGCAKRKAFDWTLGTKPSN